MFHSLSSNADRTLRKRSTLFGSVCLHKQCTGIKVYFKENQVLAAPIPLHHIAGNCWCLKFRSKGRIP